MRLLTRRSSFYQRSDYAAPYHVDVERFTDVIMHDVQRDEKTGMLGILEFVETE